MNAKAIFLSLLILVISVRVVAQSDSTFKSEGKVIIHVINRTMYQTDGIFGQYGMYINRAFLGYSHKFSPKWSGTVILDVGRPTVFRNLNVQDQEGNTLPITSSYKEGSYYTMALKYSYLEYRPTSTLKLQAGGILQNHYITQERFWGYRYIMEAYQDRYFGMPSGDLGFIGFYSPVSWLSVDAAITNGEGFRFNQDKYGNIKYAAGLDIKPLKDWINRVYYDNSASSDPTKPATQQLLSFFSGYRLPKAFRLGAEYNYHFNHGNVQDADLYGLSVFGSYEMTERVELFARYDNLKSNILNGASGAWHLADDGQAYIAGVHFVPVKNVALSISYQGWQPVNNALKYKNSIALSTEFKF